MNSSKDPDYRFKIFILGQYGVGKSSLMLRYSDGVFDESPQRTISVTMKTKTLNLDNKEVELEIGIL